MSNSSTANRTLSGILGILIASAVGFMIVSSGLVQFVGNDEHATTWNRSTNSLEQVNGGVHIVGPGDHITRYHPDDYGTSLYIISPTIELGELPLYTDIYISITIGFDDSVSYVEDHNGLLLYEEYEAFFMGDVAGDVLNTFADSYEAEELPFIEYQVAENTEYPTGDQIDPCWTIEASFDPDELINQFIEQAGLQDYPSLTIEIPETVEFYQMTDKPCEVISA